ncbi:MAG: hypothetical protein D9V45_03965 [Chloroflexi bacterium]|nr:MAG: hypothetical protein D9V45_03965 [Chloroflexota bacterium]
MKYRVYLTATAWTSDATMPKKLEPKPFEFDDIVEFDGDLTKEIAISIIQRKYQRPLTKINVLEITLLG